MELSALTEYICLKCWADNYHPVDYDTKDERCQAESGCSGKLIPKKDLSSVQRTAKKVADKKREEEERAEAKEMKKWI